VPCLSGRSHCNMQAPSEEGDRNHPVASYVCRQAYKQVTIMAEEYRRLADECCNSPICFRPAPDGLIAMAETWQRLAEEQERATDLRKKE
jgi:hypothetical protein